MRENADRFFGITVRATRRRKLMIFLTFPISHVELTKDQKTTNYEIMAAGNIILKNWHQKIQKEVCKQHGKTRYNRSKFRGELFNQIKVARSATIFGVTIPKCDIEAILAVRQIEMPMLQAHANLMDQLARKAYKMNPDCGLDLEDFFNEALMAGMNAIYCYTDTQIVFSTYLVHAIKRRLFNYALEQRGCSYDVYKLFTDYHKIRNENNGPITVDEAIKKLKLKESQVLQLSVMLNKVIHESDLIADKEDDYDFTTLARGATKVEKAGIEIDEAQSVREAITDAQLTEWEKIVLNAFLEASSSHGWRTEVAEQNINPDTGKAYSRAAPAIAMDRIKDKVLEQLEKRKVA